VDTAVLAQLNDFDPSVRKQAVMALGRSKDPAALPYLAAVVRTDPDPELRDLARKAGQYIQAQTKGAAAPAAEPPAPIQPLSGPAPAAKPPAPPKKPSAFTSNPIDEPDMGYLTRAYSEYEEEDAAALGALGAAAGTVEAAAAAPASPPRGGKRGKTPVRGETYNVSEANQRRAKDILESALTANINNDNARAMRYLYQSLMMDPNLINDGYYAQIAGGVTEAPRDEAIQMIIDQGERKTFIKSQEKAVRDERKNKHLSEARRSNWTAVAVDLLIYMLINILGPLALFFAVAESLGSLDPQLIAELERQGVTAGFSFIVYLPLVVGSAASALASFLIQAAVIHGVARYLLGGVGTFPNLLTRLLGLYNRMLAIIYAISFVAVLATFILQFSPLALCFTLPLVGASLYLGIKTLAVVGEAYDFGVLMGCIAVLAGTLLIVIVTAILSWAAVSTLIQQLQTLIATMPVTP
jgi:hypothetical protein